MARRKAARKQTKALQTRAAGNNEGLPLRLQLNEYRRAKLVEEHTFELNHKSKAWDWLATLYPGKKTVKLPLWELILLRRIYLFAADRFVADRPLPPDHQAVNVLEHRAEGPLEIPEGMQPGQAGNNFLIAFVGSKEYAELQSTFRDHFGQLPPPKVIDR